MFYVSPCTYRATPYEQNLTILDNGVFYVSPCTYRATLYEQNLTILDNGVFYVSSCKYRAPFYELYLNILDNGVFYVSPCKYGAPLVVSWWEKIKTKTENKSMLFAQCLFRPHFLDAPQHADKVEGLTPVEEKHR